jgi:hypothetical protein
MADYARIQEEKEAPFELRRFFDQINSMGNIPISLGHWEMTGTDGHLAPLKK